MRPRFARNRVSPVIKGAYVSDELLLMPSDSESIAQSWSPDSGRPFRARSSSSIGLIFWPCSRAVPSGLFHDQWGYDKESTLSSYLLLDRPQSLDPSLLQTWTGITQSSTSLIVAQSAHRWKRLCFDVR